MGRREIAYEIVADLLGAAATHSETNIRCVLKHLDAAYAAGVEACNEITVSASAVAGPPRRGETNDYADGYRYACGHIGQKIRALLAEEGGEDGCL